MELRWAITAKIFRFFRGFDKLVFDFEKAPGYLYAVAAVPTLMVYNGFACSIRFSSRNASVIFKQTAASGLFILN